MASSATLEAVLAKASAHFNDARPFIPMYLHLIVSALFPIYTGAHASLSRPSSAAKPKKKDQKADDEEQDEEDDKIQQMEGLSNTDAIVLPLTAGIVLAGLYFLIMRYGADMINLILGWYFSAVGVYSVAQLVNDGLNMAIGFILPDYYASGGSCWKVMPGKQQAVCEGDRTQTKNVPLPPFLSALPLPKGIQQVLWTLRRMAKQKYTLKAYVDTIMNIKANITIINAFSAFIGLATIIYVNTVSKPWFLTNLQGFAVSYSALQLMSPTTFGTGSLILGALFCYDIWAVFFTPLMVTVAKNLDQPIKLVFPRPDEPSKTAGEPPIKSFSMLGLGDIVLPGIMIGLALRFDLYMFYLKKQRKTHKVVADSSDKKKTEEIVDKAPYVSPTGRWGDRFWTYSLPSRLLPSQLQVSFPKPYFTASMIGYVIGMLTTLGVMSVFQHAQPALLYLVPGVLTSLWGTALVRRELNIMWDFTEAVNGEQLEEDEDDGSKKDVQAEQAPKGLFERLWQELWGDTKKADKTGADDSKDKRAPKSSGEISGKQKDEESGKEKLKDVVFYFSLLRYNPHSRRPAKSNGSEGEDTRKREEMKGSSTTKRTGNDSTSASPSDMNGATEPRYRTRSARSPTS